MKFIPLIWKNVWRRKFRTTFTLLSIFVAFLLFGILMTIRTAFGLGIEIAGLDRLVLINKVSLIIPLPLSYQRQLQQVPGVALATHQTWFGGIYQDPANFFANMAVEPEPFMKVYPEFKVPAEQVKAWLEDRQGAIVGKDLAARFGWKVGDRIPLGRGAAFPVRFLAPNHSLVMADDNGGFGWSWEFGLYQTGRTETTLVSRNRARVPSSWRWAIGMRVLEPAAFLMTRRMLLGLQRRAEALAADTGVRVTRAA